MNEIIEKHKKENKLTLFYLLKNLLQIEVL